MKISDQNFIERYESTQTEGDLIKLFFQVLLCMFVFIFKAIGYFTSILKLVGCLAFPAFLSILPICDLINGEYSKQTIYYFIVTLVFLVVIIFIRKELINDYHKSISEIRETLIIKRNSFSAAYDSFIKARRIRKKRKTLLVDAGLSEKGAERQYNISKYIYYFFLAHQVCKLNNSASYSQENLLKGLFGFDDATIKKYVFEKDYTLTDLDFLAKHSKVLLLKEKKSFADLLFKLSFVQDGIHNDEWNLLMQFLKQLKFNDNYIAFFKRRYGPLRTEFDEDKKDNVATELRNTSYLKPYYAILGLDETASDEEVKKAYHALALEHHPDLPKNAGRIQECEEMMAKINEAYEKLKA